VNELCYSNISELESLDYAMFQKVGIDAGRMKDIVCDLINAYREFIKGSPCMISQCLWVLSHT